MGQQLFDDKNFSKSSFTVDKYWTTFLDYSGEYKVDETTIGVCEIMGKRDDQEDDIAIDIDKVKGFDSLTKEQQSIALHSTFEELQNKYGQESRQGSTACVVTSWLDQKNNINLVTANLGDSTAFLITTDGFRNDASSILRLNKLHKPSDLEEKERIESLGDSVEYGRINGIISVSRAFGDLRFKSMSHIPAITFEQKPLNPDSKAFVVVACDGLEEDLSPDEINSIVLKHATDMPCEIAKSLVSQAFKSGSRDNISVIVIPVSEKCVSAAVFDGHGGNKVSKDLGNYFYSSLEKELTLIKDPEQYQKCYDRIQNRLNAETKKISDTHECDLLNNIELKKKSSNLQTMSLFTQVTQPKDTSTSVQLKQQTPKL